MTWWVIVNPTAGRPGEVTTYVRNILTTHGVESEVHESKSPEHVREIIAAGHDIGVRQFAGVGGDGTAHMLLNTLMQLEWESPPGLAILPAGSGSDFIRTFSLPRTVESMVPRLLSDDWHTTDILRIEGSFGTVYSLNAIEAGVGAAATSAAKSFPRRVEEMRYTIAFLFTLPLFRSEMVKVSVDDHKQVVGKAIEIVIANGQFFGGGMNVAPQANVSDGLADVQVFLGGRSKALTVMPKMVKGKHLNNKNLQYISGRSIQLQLPDDWPIEADGEILGNGSISVTVLPKAIEFKI
jgi:YegS/Rv2252/BmrU family lipid kinase